MSRLGFLSHIAIEPLLCLFCVFALRLALSPSLLIFAVMGWNLLLTILYSGVAQKYSGLLIIFSLLSFMSDSKYNFGYKLHEALSFVSSLKPLT